jgi:hypothetical protein
MYTTLDPGLGRVRGSFRVSRSCNGPLSPTLSHKGRGGQTLASLARSERK